MHFQKNYKTLGSGAGASFCCQKYFLQQNHIYFDKKGLANNLLEGT